MKEHLNKSSPRKRGSSNLLILKIWIPACAGMTGLFRLSLETLRSLRLSGEFVAL